MKVHRSALPMRITLEIIVLTIAVLSLLLTSISSADAYPILRLESVNRTIAIQPEGDIVYSDSYSIRNVGETRVVEVSIHMPKDTKDVVAYDLTGAINVVATELEDRGMIDVTFRYPLRGEEGNVTYDDVYSFTVKYEVSAQERITKKDQLGRHIFKSEEFIGISISRNWLYGNGEISVILPEGARSLQTTSLQGERTLDGFTESLTYPIDSEAPLGNYPISVEYDYFIFWSAFRPSLGGVSIIGIILAIHKLRRHVKPLSPRILKKDTSLIDAFVEICEERMTMWSEIESLETGLDNKKIRKKDYNRRRRILQQRLRGLNRAYEKVEKKVRRDERGYVESIDKIENSNKELEFLKGEIRRLRNQHRSGRLSKNPYRKLRSGYDKQVEQVIKSIEGVIVYLREIKGR